VRDLQEGLEVIETYARKELGMLKNNEIFVQYAKPNEKAVKNGKPATAGQ
jgi:cell division protein FtsB